MAIRRVRATHSLHLIHSKIGRDNFLKVLPVRENQQSGRSRINDSQSYRLLRSFILQTETWRSFDPFYEQKLSTFKHSSKSIFGTLLSLYVGSES